MAVNYNDSRFQEVEQDKNVALNETKNTYNEMINNSQSQYQEMIDASKDYANTQSELQQQNTNLAIDKINQAKDQAEKQYTREQKGAYTDYQKATNQYGANAEQMAAQGLNATGYSESARMSAYNTYQNRYAMARESYNQAVLNYDNSIKEAQLANNSALAQIAYEALQKQLELSLQGFQYKNQLVLQKLDAVNAQEDRYYSRYQDVLQQINTENALAEQIRQYNEKMALEKEQFAFNKQQAAEEMAFKKQQAAQEQARWEKEYALSKAKASSSSSRSSSSGSAKLTSGSSGLSNSSSRNTLSKGGNAMNATLSVLQKSLSMFGGNPTNTMKNAINQAYNNKKIDESDVRILASKYGF